MKISPDCPVIAKSSDRYFCQVLGAERSGMEEEICSLCPGLREQTRELPCVKKALLFAADAHRGQMRKGTTIPYLIHLIRTWDYVRQMTEDPEELAAALLHDVLEDTSVTYRELQDVFGVRVAELVAGESEYKREEYPAEETWQIRKQETIHRLQSCLGEEQKRPAMHIALADKLANLFSMAYEYRHVGDSLWQKFNQREKSMHGWYYRQMGEVFTAYFSQGRERSLVEEYQIYYREVFGEYEI